METSKAPTIHDVAQLARVSLSTVSRVLNDYEAVNPQTRERVETAIKKLNYEKSKSDTVKPGRKKKTVGLIIPDIVDPFYPLLIKGIEQVAKIHGYHLILCDSENDISMEEQHIDNLYERGVDGVILIPSPETTSVENLVKSGLPFVFLNRFLEMEGASYVVSDNEEGAYQAIKYLLKLGHRQIVHLSGPQAFSTEKSRITGCKRALAEEGLQCEKDLYIEGNYGLEDAYAQIKALLQKNVSFTAIFAANDMMAFGAKQALKEHGLNIPDDISLVGYDDICFSSVIALTTVAQPSYEMGRNAMVLLIDFIEGRVSSPQQIVLRPSMIIRESCQRH
ncbi:LacI family transcriptional regulator [candidate division KSB3 bacterium]|uniref:LacI family transcriptional regulator n=1 Tax=candidate division KSB3 bacterium TaxID=2044937 RepID=A0A2G6KLU5_9BACT|nr:MAG: LacI family transcriptional regulator [candidate division KSB3 bacterium]